MGITEEYSPCSGVIESGELSLEYQWYTSLCGSSPGRVAQFACFAAACFKYYPPFLAGVVSLTAGGCIVVLDQF